VTDATVPLRVTVLDAWDEIAMTVPTDTTIDAVKRRALSEARVTDAAEDFVVKFRGIELREPQQSVGMAALPQDAALIVLRRGRPPVR
jgi:hypothetical protein